jgi:AraC-like DNA-binding protein/mannose-6-phosphate isomerase-like protein (cupin superfamily)
MNYSSEPRYLRVDTSDNVAVILNRGGLPEGSQFSCGLILTETIPEAHKFALVDLAEGESIVHYETVIGFAKRAILRGSWVHDGLIMPINRKFSADTRNTPVEVRFPEEGINITESHHGSDFRRDWASHKFMKILYIRAGSGTLWRMGRKDRLQAPCIVLIPAGTQYRLDDNPSNPLSILILSIQNNFVTKLTTERGLTSCQVISHRTLCATTKGIVEDILYEQFLNHPRAEVLITGKVLELVGLLIHWRTERLRETNETPFEQGLSHARVAASIRNLELNFNHAPSLEEAAERVGLKPRRYSQLFHLITGKSWTAFLRHKRVEHAKHLLIETDRSIITVSFECGFEDISSFYRAFSRVEGLSPNAWRKRERDQLRKSA